MLAHTRTDKKDGPCEARSTHIRVAVRCRAPREEEQAGEAVLDVNASDGTVTVAPHPPFAFDVVFPLDVSQLDVFRTLGVDMVAAALDGFNASLFAYGQVIFFSFRCFKLCECYLGASMACGSCCERQAQI